MITRKSQYKHNSMTYSNWEKLCQYLLKNCTDKDYGKSMTKLDKFKIIMEGLNIMNKAQANEIATSAICHLDGEWKNITFYNLGWVPSIESVDCPGLTMIYSTGVDDWSIYIEPTGYYSSGKTPNIALSNCRKALKEEEQRIKQRLFDVQQIISLIEG